MIQTHGQGFPALSPLQTPHSVTALPGASSVPRAQAKALPLGKQVPLEKPGQGEQGHRSR